MIRLHKNSISWILLHEWPLDVAHTSTHVTSRPFTRADSTGITRLPAEEQHKRLPCGSGAERHNNKATGEMSGFENRLQSYSSTQLHELLEDDDKLRRMVREMEEVGSVPESDQCSSFHRALLLSCVTLLCWIRGQRAFAFDYSSVISRGVLLTEGVAGWRDLRMKAVWTDLINKDECDMKTG